MARFARPQFSLATLLIAMTWSGAMVWINITPRVVECMHSVRRTYSHGFYQPSIEDRLTCTFAYGCLS